ncbi:permease for cytosine/purines, uracil, thiamine, allantoin-domain-containing protein [Lipomyces japonicus]|uniref:permease for cytosine/purines, uracil, thiamine, allantoin-domain-containing protein n=1 Tax=Lipomyces japonicus TaxID=56871 RepID=UPI0034CF96A4
MKTATEFTVEDLGTSSEASSGFGRFVKRLQVKDHSDSRRSNRDLDPVPPEKQTWSALDYISYWISDNFTPGGWRNASSIMEVGLSWKLALVNIAISQLIIGVVVTLNGFIGAKYRIPFSVISRASYGYYFSYLMILMRCIVGIFWYGISTYTGAECVRSMIYAIWPSFRHLKNTLPESANINTQFMTAYVVYYISIMPLHYIPIHRIRWLFTVKAIALPIIGFAIMGWTIKNAGVGNNSLWNQGNTVHGSELSWVFMSCLYANLGSWATLAINSPDFTRYTVRPRNTYTMAIALPFTASLVAFFGVVGAAGSKVLYNTILWDPLLFIDEWTSKSGRAAAFFCAAGFYLAQACSNVSANSISAANDLNCMFPKYINIRRGQFIVSILGAWVLTPWNILTSAGAFLSFMSGYTVWLAPICGIMLSDFYFVHKRKYNVWELYKNDGIYSYNKYGINWRAFVAFFCGWVPLLPGFLPTVNSSIHVPVGVKRFYYCGYFYGLFAPMLVYFALCSIWPAKETIVDVAVYPTQVFEIHDIEEFIGQGSDEIADTGDSDSYGEKSK